MLEKEKLEAIRRKDARSQLEEHFKNNHVEDLSDSWHDNGIEEYVFENGRYHHVMVQTIAETFFGEDTVESDAMAEEELEEAGMTVCDYTCPYNFLTYFDVISDFADSAENKKLQKQALDAIRELTTSGEAKDNLRRVQLLVDYYAKLRDTELDQVRTNTW